MLCQTFRYEKVKLNPHQNTRHNLQIYFNSSLSFTHPQVKTVHAPQKKKRCVYALLVSESPDWDVALVSTCCKWSRIRERILGKRCSGVHILCTAVAAARGGGRAGTMGSLTLP